MTPLDNLDNQPGHEANPRLRYKVGDSDGQGRRIDMIFSHFEQYTIYEANKTLQVEGDTTRLDACPQLNLLLNKAIALSRGHQRRKRQVFYQLSTAIDQCMAGHPGDAVKTMHGLIDALSRRAVSVSRLYYLSSAVSATVLLWLAVIVINVFLPGADVMVWSIVVALGGTGALFSVMLNQRNISVDLDDSAMVHWAGGASRVAIGMIAGGICHLAIKAKIALTFVIDAPEYYGVYFFCFVAGFSETFVPNLLRSQESENAAKGESRAKSESPPPG